MAIMLVDTHVFKKSEHTRAGVLRRIALYRKAYDIVNTWETDDAWIAQGIILAKNSVEADSSPGDVPVNSAPAMIIPSTGAQPISDDGAGSRVVEAALNMIQEEQTADHCWAWVNAAYEAADVGRRQIWPERDYVYAVPGRDIKVMGFYDPAENLQRLGNLAPGDWIFINNRNSVDINGNHSVVFMDWQDQQNWIARVAQLSRGRREPPKVKAYDLVDMPLAHHSKPKIN